MIGAQQIGCRDKQHGNVHGTAGLERLGGCFETTTTSAVGDRLQESVQPTTV